MLSDSENSLLTKSLNSTISCKTFDDADYLENFDWGICNLDILFDEDFDLVKAKTKEAALSPYRTYSNNVPQNSSHNELIALQNLSKNKFLIIQKSDKDNFAVIADRQDYIKKMDNILRDQKNYHSKFERWYYIEFCFQSKRAQVLSNIFESSKLHKNFLNNLRLLKA